jgi:hypothetical protein
VAFVRGEPRLEDDRWEEPHEEDGRGELHQI